MKERDPFELVQRMRAGDVEAGQTFEAEVRARLERFCRGYLHDADRARDLASEAIARLLASDRTPVPVMPWLLRVARNLCFDSLRAQGERGAVPLDSAFVASLTGPLTKLARIDEQRALERRLERLSETERELLRLRYVDELGREEIAGLFEWTVAQVKSRTFEALRKLRD